jgi:orotidine-5'-phosphate decarboxylase
LILALDFPSIEPAIEFAQRISTVVGIFKINIQLFTSAGPSALEKLNRLGPGVFLDLKFHDIPNTVKGAVSSALALPGICLLDVHALGGLEMMRAAVNARDEASGSKSPLPKLLAPGSPGNSARLWERLPDCGSRHSPGAQRRCGGGAEAQD